MTITWERLGKIGVDIICTLCLVFGVWQFYLIATHQVSEDFAIPLIYGMSIFFAILYVDVKNVVIDYLDRKAIE